MRFVELLRRGVLFVVGLLVSVVLLALVAAVPILGFYSLGYLLEVQGRLARGARLRDAFPMIEHMPWLGGVVLGIWTCLIPLRLLYDMLEDARLIDAGSSSTGVLERVFVIFSMLVAFQLVVAIARGGRFSFFFRPIRNARWLRALMRHELTLPPLRDRVYGLQTGLAFRETWWLGFRGFAGALMWLLVPVGLFVAAERTDGPGVIVTLIGGAALAFVLTRLPVLQSRFAATRDFSAYLEWNEAASLFRTAPVTWSLATLALYLLTFPLFLLEFSLLPRDALWLITLVFVGSVLPAKVLLGWAHRRALRLGREAHPAAKWTARVVYGPLVLAYVGMLFFVPFVEAHGKLGLFFHHAFVLPMPF